MVKNRYGGNKAKKKRNEKETSTEMIFKSDGQLYGRINSVLGNKRFEVFCNDGTTKLGILAGSLKKKHWINTDDIVLIDEWDFQNKKCSIVHKYSEENINTLLISNEITEVFRNNPNSFTYCETNNDPFDWDINDDITNETTIKSIDGNKNNYLPSELLPNDESDESINIDDI